MEQAPEQAGGEEAVIEPLIGGEHRRVVGLLLAYCERSSAPAAWSRETSPAPENRHAAAATSATRALAIKLMLSPNRHGFRVDASTRGVKSARSTLERRDTPMTNRRRETFHLDRLATPIGTALLVTDADGVLRALDWDDYEARMRELLRLQYGAVTLKDGARARAMQVGAVGLFQGRSRPPEGRSSGAPPARRSSARSGTRCRRFPPARR